MQEEGRLRLRNFTSPIISERDRSDVLLRILLLVTLRALRWSRSPGFLVAVDTCAGRCGGVVERRLFTCLHPCLGWLGVAGRTGLLGRTTRLRFARWMVTSVASNWMFGVLESNAAHWVTVQQNRLRRRSRLLLWSSLGGGCLEQFALLSVPDFGRFSRGRLLFGDHQR